MGITRYYPRSGRTYHHNKCNDCGEDLTPQNTDGSQRDVCNTCWLNRGWVLDNGLKMGIAKFQEIQAAMRGKSHRAKTLIEALKANA